MEKYWTISNISRVAAVSISDFMDNKIPENLINKEVLKIKGRKKNV